MFEFNVRTNSQTELVKIDHLVNRAIEESGIKDGICEIFIPHTTAAVTINEGADPSVVRDFLFEINKVIPLSDGYHHSEGNSAAHIKSSLVGCSETVIVENGRAKLGTWQSVFFCEFDGPRSRRVWIKII
ncbi:MAG: YjbQ family protein [Calditrichaeota bacterium]|nr:YjbQ family protein [Calditrichota bacterium]